MSDDYRRTVQDHYDALHLIKEGLEEANALKVFFISVAKAVQELDESDADISRQTLFLTTLDNSLKSLHQDLGSGPKTVDATETYREVLDQHLAKMRIYRDPSH